MHGLGFNVNSNLSYFNHIIPCGISDKSVTSMSKELGQEIDLDALSNKLLRNMANAFDFTYLS